MVKPNQAERRRHPRIRLETSVDLGLGESGLSCVIQDLSLSGAAVVLDRPLREFDLLGIRARIAFEALPPVELAGEALVVRCQDLGDGRHEAGLFFHALEEESRRQLENFFAAVAVQPTHS